MHQKELESRPVVAHYQDVAQSPNRRFPALDLLRLVAISMTILVHVPSISSKVWGIRSIAGSLYLGVDLFMLISGWLLGGQVLREKMAGTLSIPRFYFKRWMRTLPPYYAMLILLILVPGTPMYGVPLGTFVSHVLFFQEYGGVQSYGVSWSLCVEEHFYLLLPWLVLAVVRTGRGYDFAWVGVLVSIAEIAARYVHLQTSTDGYLVTHMRSEGLFLGVALAQLSLQSPRIWCRVGEVARVITPLSILILLAAMCLATSTASSGIWLPTIGTWLMVPLFVACVYERSPMSRINFPGLMFGGEVTYSLYLTHSVVPAFVPKLDGAAGKLTLLVAMVASAVLLRQVVEVPFMRLRQSILARRPAAISATEASR